MRTHTKRCDTDGKVLQQDERP